MLQIILEHFQRIVGAVLDPDACHLLTFFDVDLI